MTMNNAPIFHIACAFGLHGPSLTISNACASSSMAIGEGLRWIQSGVADVVVVGGAEAMLTPCIIRAWQGLTVLAPADEQDTRRSCKPFSADRNGIVLAEGASALVLERADHAKARGATQYAQISGYATSLDSTHLSRPHPAGQSRAMINALRMADISPNDVGYINAHGTGTYVGDAVEVNSICIAFGSDGGQIPVSSTKALHGHMMGAAGATEFIAAILAMQHDFIPPTAHLDKPDPEFGLDFVANAGRNTVGLNCVMSNSFAFGGANSVLVAQRI